MSQTKLPLVRGGVVYALAAAALFGASTPFAKVLVGQVDPVLLAGLLYLGSGCGLFAWDRLWLRRKGHRPSEASLRRADVPWLAGAVLFGGVVAPVLLMTGLAATPASTASLLLNMEGVLTALLAWFVFRENFDRRIALGMAAITAGGVLLSWEGGSEVGIPLGAFAVAGACLAWAIDNNLTRKVSAGDPMQIAAIKGLVAGTVNVGVALVRGAEVPDFWTVAACGIVGLAGYGVSLTLFVLALRNLGTARTGAYFSVAPFVGAVISLALLGDRPTVTFFLAAALMGVGVWLHLTERHEHEHEHEAMSHDHTHVHDEHHQHEHGPDDPPGEPHSHQHDHSPMRHSHPHYPDIHHRHRH
ncbi:membrane protein : Transporter of the DMT superfamily OS=Janthinobacterium sp. (strain Marseille) GN=cnrT PE=4 SV=1: EamA: EamA [Gemmataceae bacterium]|nr:membrane protein : Transporter of the DMT superfamily OS=Janthinobacterium sp. (strain Marseille) GN=cnrT PE=4 SV=1: EamA: EamA [Gemmataceae bacterium]VTU01446.1 membrane protein : Transporter of the DMT superfamily OS=Janthinobacterium sp. (strain Marseille) GN=cnrT PE=4 SV=1: EamA: EamA [Gemmataceae bacterium]